MSVHPNEVACHDFDVSIMHKDLRENFVGFGINMDKDCAVFKDYFDKNHIKYPDIYGSYQLGGNSITFGIEHRAHAEQWRWSEHVGEDDEGKFTAEQYHSKFHLDIVDSQYRMAKKLNYIAKGLLLIETNRYHTICRDKNNKPIREPKVIMEPPPSLVSCAPSIRITSPLDYYILDDFDWSKFNPDVSQTYPQLAQSDGVYYVQHELHDRIAVPNRLTCEWNETNIVSSIRRLYKKMEKIRRSDIEQTKLIEF